MVGPMRLELICLSTRDFKSLAYTDSATGPWLFLPCILGENALFFKGRIDFLGILC